MSKRNKLISILIVIIALIILIGLIFFMFLAPAPESNNESRENQQTGLPETNKVQPEEIKTVEPTVQRVMPKTGVTENDLKRIASSFVERYGTYSNQAGYSNINDLEIFMSRSMKEWAGDYIKQALANSGNTGMYYGITTKVVVSEAISFKADLGRAEFRIKTQRQESIGTGSNIRKFQQDAIVKMVKEGGLWKVDRVVWEE
ncbi:MAG: hypothetical protein WC323_03880 [Patescibacteria group bacterium]|jgi:hypothetical protein